MQLVHVSWTQYQTVMIDVGRDALPRSDRPQINDRLWGDARGHKTDFSGPKFLESQEFQTEHLVIKVEGPLEVLGIHHQMIETHYVHGSLLRDGLCAHGAVGTTPSGWLRRCL